MSVSSLALPLELSCTLLLKALAPLIRFDFAHAPLRDVRWPLGVSACYVVVSVAMSWYMRSVRGGRGFGARRLLAAHNLFLCVLSLLMTVGTSLEVIRRTVEEQSPRWMFCEDPATQPRGALWFWTYVFYLSKYYELLDTVLQLLKGRPPAHFLLHVYHHTFVPIIVWSWLPTKASLQHIGLICNTGVHTVMYYYYFRRVLGLECWWKRCVTKIQIVQFCISVACCAITIGHLAQGAECAGKRVMLVNVLFNLTLLYQFVGVLTSGDSRRAVKSKQL